MEARVAVEISGVTQTRKELRKFAPDVLKELDKANRDSSRWLIAKVQDRYPDEPLTGWLHTGRLGWNLNDVKRGVKVKQGKKKRGEWWSALLQISQNSAAGMLFEWAGRKNRALNPQGAHFLAVMNQLYGRVQDKADSMRIMLPVVLANSGKYQAEIIANYEKAERELQLRLDATDTQKMLDKS